MSTGFFFLPDLKLRVYDTPPIFAIGVILQFEFRAFKYNWRLIDLRGTVVGGGRCLYWSASNITITPKPTATEEMTDRPQSATEPPGTVLKSASVLPLTM